MSQCVRNTIVEAIVGNATSYQINKDKTEIFIPARKFGSNAAYRIAERLVEKANKLFSPAVFGSSVSLNTSYSDGTAVNIQPTKKLIDSYDVKDNIKSVDEVFERNLSYFNGDQALMDQEMGDDLQFQLDVDRIEGQAIKELDDYLKGFLKQFNVKFKEFDDLKSKLGVNALGATDILNKLIWYSKNRNEETLPEEAAHMLVMLMGEANPEIVELMANIQNWDQYKSIKNQYGAIYNNDENKIKIEAIGKLIAKSLVNNYKVVGLDKSMINRILDKIFDFLNNLTMFNVFRYNENLADKIALNVLSGNADYIYKITNLNPNVNYEKEVKNNPFSKSFIDLLTANGAKLTGSLSIALSGENIRRPEGNGIHNLDFRVSSKKQFEEVIVPLIEKFNNVPAHFGWHKKDYSTYSYMIAEEGLTIDVLNRKEGFHNGFIDRYRLLDKDGNEVEITQQNVVAIDFFVYKDGKDKNISNEKFESASQVYDGKASLSGKTNPLFFYRSKDQEDFVLRDPVSFENFDNKYIFFQLPENQVYYNIKATNILQSDKGKKIFEKGNKANWTLDKILTELQIPKEQQQLILFSGLTNREEIITDLLANYSYTVEINTAIVEDSNVNVEETINNLPDSFGNGYVKFKKVNNKWYRLTSTNEFYKKDFEEIELTPYYKNAIVTLAKELSLWNSDIIVPKRPDNTTHYSNLTVPGGTNYTENEIATPAITPSIKGHAQFATDNGIGWFRSDDKIDGGKPGGTGILSLQLGNTRRILELQSDLFQKGRNREDLITDNKVNSEVLPGMKGNAKIEEYLQGYEVSLRYYSPEMNYSEQDIQKLLKDKENELLSQFKPKISNENQFLQLLNKDNNWVTFFVKSIIKDSAKKGYEKVLFPSGDTANKIEGQETLSQFLYNKETSLKFNKESIEKHNNALSKTGEEISLNGKLWKREELESIVESFEKENAQLEKEIADAKSGKDKFSAINKFYETDIFNILKKQEFNPTRITDEYGNDWYQVNISESKVEEKVEEVPAVNISTRIMEFDDSIEGGEISNTEVRFGDKVIGEIMAENDGIYMTVFNTNIDGPKNSGTFAYLQLAREAADKGVQLRSDRISDRLSEPAVRLWERFIRSGLAEKVDNHYLFTGKSEDFDESITAEQPESQIIEEENNDSLTESQDTGNELNSKFEELLSKGVISQICI